MTQMARPVASCIVLFLLCLAGQADAAGWAGCYEVEKDRIEIRQEAGVLFIPGGIVDGREVRLVLAPATQPQLDRLRADPYNEKLSVAMVIDHALHGTRVIRSPMSTLPEHGMYRRQDGSLLGIFPFVFGPMKSIACPGSKPPPPDPWVGCYKSRTDHLAEVRQDRETLYIPTGMEGMYPTRLLLAPATRRELDAMTTIVSRDGKDRSVQFTSGLVVYGTSLGTHTKVDRRETGPSAGLFRVRQGGNETTHFFGPFAFEELAKVPCTAN